MSTAWYDYDVYSDYPATSYHNTDVGTPTDTPLTAPLPGKVTADTYQPWGGQLTIQADDPSQIGGIPYYFLIHMDAINPNLSVGSHVNQGDFLGYSGGQLDNSGLQALPAGYTHHTTDPSHSTGPHLDIGVTSSPQGSMDTNKTWSDRLVNLARQMQIPFGTGQGSSNTSTADKQQWALDLLAALGNTNPDPAQVQFVSGWEHAESGSSGGAQNNPLNTEEQNTPGVLSLFNPAGVVNYDTYQHGIQAEAKVLNNGLYGPLLTALETPGASSDAALGVTSGTPSPGVQQSLLTWGTSDWQSIYSNLGAGSEPISASGGGGICASCNSLPAASRPVWCLFCPVTTATDSITAGAQSAAQSLLPSWLQSPPWKNKSLLNVLGRLGFMVLGGGMIIGGVYIAVKSLADTTGVSEKVSEATQKATSTAKRAAAAVATEGASEAAGAGEKAASKGGSKGKSKSSGGAGKLKKQTSQPAAPSQQQTRSVTTNRPDVVKVNTTPAPKAA